MSASNKDLVVEVASFLERVVATARTGLAFKPEGYDAERYNELLRHASQLRALLDGGALTPEQVAQRWREQVESGFDGYVTTAVGVGVITFDRHDRILMIKRLNGRWWYPTGFCDVGLSPAENAAKEALEETGLVVTPRRLMAVIDSRKLGSAARHIYSMLFYCSLDGGTLNPSPLETRDAGFFGLDQLPQPTHMASTKWVELARQFHFEGRTQAHFDEL